ncbi:MAG: carbohydrate kinase [Acidobacteriota bacterium]|nr:carbohydrate kinase [Acidobacteriota bacterium]
MPEVVCFGEALIDFLAEPAPAEGGPRRFLQYAGGAPANVAVAVARLGSPSAFVGMLGEDMFGDFLLESFRAAGVRTDRIVRTAEANTALAFVSLAADGERRFSFYRPPAADLLFRPSDFTQACFADATVFHTCSNSLTEPAIAKTTMGGLARAREAGAVISVDVNFRPSLWPKDADPRPRLWDQIREADLVKLDRSELAFLGETLGGDLAAFDAIRDGRARLIAVTDGAEPVRYWTRKRQGRIGTFHVEPINTTAAGDAFTGGLLHYLMSEGIGAAGFEAFTDDPAAVWDAVLFASACGALATTRHGAFTAMPTQGEVLRLLGSSRS